MPGSKTSWEPGRFSGGNRPGPRQDDAFGIEGNDLRVIHIPGADFRVDPTSRTAGDQLRILGAEIQYQDFRENEYLS